MYAGFRANMSRKSKEVDDRKAVKSCAVTMIPGAIKNIFIKKNKMDFCKYANSSDDQIYALQRM